jgi:hypothetical protein
MNQFFICAECGAENEINLELADGDRQRKSVPCESCDQINIVEALFNYTINEFELDVSIDDAG